MRPLLAAFLLPSLSALLLGQPPSSNARRIQGRRVCATAPSNGQTLTWSVANGCWQPGAGGTARILLHGIAAKCQSAVAGAGFSLPSADAPTPTCDADGQQAYLKFAAGMAQTIYDRIELPADWTGVLKLVMTAWSTGQNQPTINAYIACVGAAATSNPSYGGAQAVTLVPGAASVRMRVSTTLSTTGCAATNALYLKLAITANTTDLNVLSASLTE